LQVSPLAQLLETGIYFGLAGCLLTNGYSYGLEDVLRSQLEQKSLLRFREYAHDRSVQRRVVGIDICKNLSSFWGSASNVLRHGTHATSLAAC